MKGARKAAFYFPLLAVFTLVVVAMMAVALVPKVLPLSSAQIGVRQFELIDARAEAQKAAEYVRLSAEKAVLQAWYDHAASGGIQESACGAVDGINLWSSEGRECYPSQEEWEGAFRYWMSFYHDSYIAAYTHARIPINNFLYEPDPVAKRIRVASKTQIEAGIVPFKKEAPAGSIAIGNPAQISVSDPQAYREGLQAFPVSGDVTFTNDWGFARPQGTHEGTDVFPKDRKEGTPVVSAASGKVYSYGCNSLGGNFVSIVDGRGVLYYYAHLSRISENVKAAHQSQRALAPGEALGEVGTTIGCRPGCSAKSEECGIPGQTAPHLHFGIYVNGNRAQNPYYALKGAEGKLFRLTTVFSPERSSGTYSLPLDFYLAPPEGFFTDYGKLTAGSKELVAACSKSASYQKCLAGFNGERDGLVWKIGCGGALPSAPPGAVKVCVEGAEVTAYSKADRKTQKRRVEYRFGVWLWNAGPGGSAEAIEKIGSTAAALGIPEDVALAVAYQESGLSHFDADGKVKVNSACAVGIMQIVPYYLPPGESPSYLSCSDPGMCAKCMEDKANAVIPACPAASSAGSAAGFLTMQDIGDMDANIACGLQLLKGKYEFAKDKPAEYDPFGCGYSYPDPWDRALRGYVGWGCAHPEYVSLVNSHRLKFTGIG